MNRSLWIPASGCVLAFAGLLTALHVASGRELSSEQVQQSAYRQLDRSEAVVASREVSTTAPAAAGPAAPLTVEHGQEVLSSVANEYLRPWREWESSPRRLFSRAAPRAVPTLFAEVEMTPIQSEADGFLLANIRVGTKEEMQDIPCVVDRATGSTRFFADGKWLSTEQWLAKAPRP